MVGTTEGSRQESEKEQSNKDEMQEGKQILSMFVTKKNKKERD